MIPNFLGQIGQCHSSRIKNLVQFNDDLQCLNSPFQLGSQFTLADSLSRYEHKQDAQQSDGGCVEAKMDIVTDFFSQRIDHENCDPAYRFHRDLMPAYLAQAVSVL